MATRRSRSEITVMNCTVAPPAGGRPVVSGEDRNKALSTWWRVVLVSDGSTVAYVPDAATAVQVADALSERT